MKKSLLSFLLMLLPILASADPVEIEGVWYNIIPKAQIAEVTKNPSGDKYTGDVTIQDIMSQRFWMKLSIIAKS